MYLTESTGEALDISHQAANLLLDARSKGVLLQHLPAHCRPGNLEAGLQIQNAVSQRLVASGDPAGGWKSASPSAEKIIAAPVYRSVIHSLEQHGARVKVNPVLQQVLIEPELALVLNTDLPPRKNAYSEEEINACIGEVRLALEIIGSRYADPGKVTFPELLADGLLNSGMVIGTRIEPHFASIPETIDMTIRIGHAGAKTIKGIHPEVSVLRPLYWLVGFLNKRGIGLKAGQAIITGSYAGVLTLPRNEIVNIQFGVLGDMELTFE